MDFLELFRCSLRDGYYEHFVVLGLPFLASMLGVCRAFHDRRSPLYVLMVLSAGFPCLHGVDAYNTYVEYLPLFRVRHFPPLPPLRRRASLHASAQERICQGTVLFIYLQCVDGRVELYATIHGGVLKTITHSVVTVLSGAVANLPECDCPYSLARDTGHWCSHMLMIPYLLDRIRCHFENIEYRPKGRAPYSGADKELFCDIFHVMEVGAASRDLRAHLKREAKRRGLFEGSKLAYLEKFGLKSYSTTSQPIVLRTPPASTLTRAAPKVKKTTKPNAKRAKKAKTAVVVESDGEDEATTPAVPRKQRAKLDRDVFIILPHSNHTVLGNGEGNHLHILYVASIVIGDYHASFGGRGRQNDGAKDHYVLSLALNDFIAHHTRHRGTRGMALQPIRDVVAGVHRRILLRA